MSAPRLLQPENVVPAIVLLQEHFESVRQGEIHRARSRLRSFSPEQENAIESLTRGIIDKIIHPAITVLKAASAENGSAAFVEMVLRIFISGALARPNIFGRFACESPHGAAVAESRLTSAASNRGEPS